MFAAIAQFFTTITTLFGAVDRGAKAIDHLAQWAEESSGAFADQARVERQARLVELQKLNKLKSIAA